MLEADVFMFLEAVRKEEKAPNLSYVINETVKRYIEMLRSLQKSQQSIKAQGQISELEQKYGIQRRF